MPALEVVNVAKSFGARRVLHDVSFRVEAENAIALLGASGCGKTTLLRVIAGLEDADNGEVRIGARVVSSPRAVVPPEQRGIGMVFQDLALWPHMRAWRHLEFVLRGRGKNRRERLEIAKETLARLGLAHRANAFPAEMSGGEQQRLAFARAMVTEPALLLLDEPFSNLNAELRESLLIELQRQMHERKVAVVIATHDETEVSQIVSGRVHLDTPL
ncbi:MAG: ATP-binding cassette domain-containing protein [Candidatus Hydrogenedentes bacterium]|nr:ATP-binding cassette domain-containing protein [Candidatus Hydrogenedentota bacterium]